MIILISLYLIRNLIVSGDKSVVVMESVTLY